MVEPLLIKKLVSRRRCVDLDFRVVVGMSHQESVNLDATVRSIINGKS